MIGPIGWQRPAATLGLHCAQMTRKPGRIYRARKYGLQNIVKKDPGRAKQKSQGTAGRNFTKPRTSHFFDLCM